MPLPSLRYETLLNLLQHAPWRDRSHLLTLAWRVMGLLSSGWIALSEWTPRARASRSGTTGGC